MSWTVLILTKGKNRSGKLRPSKSIFLSLVGLQNYRDRLCYKLIMGVTKAGKRLLT